MGLGFESNRTCPTPLTGSQAGAVMHPTSEILPTAKPPLPCQRQQRLEPSERICLRIPSLCSGLRLYGLTQVPPRPPRCPNAKGACLPPRLSCAVITAEPCLAPTACRPDGAAAPAMSTPAETRAQLGDLLGYYGAEDVMHSDSFCRSDLCARSPVPGSDRARSAALSGARQRFPGPRPELRPAGPPADHEAQARLGN